MSLLVAYMTDHEFCVMMFSIVSLVVRECVMVTRINEEGPAAAAITKTAQATTADNANRTTIAPTAAATADENNASAPPAEATPLLTVRARALRNGLKN